MSTAVSLPGFYNLQVTASDGTLAANHRLYTYSPGTTTKKVAYTEATGTTAHTYASDGSGGEYIALNARGELAAPLFLQAGGYDLTLKTALGATVWTRRAYGVTTDIAASVIDGAVTVVNSITELRALLKTSASKHAYLTGYYSATSGGGGHFSYVASDITSSDNGGTIIVATDGGRWYRDFTGPVHAEWFGFVADADPGTRVSAGGYGATNVTALNNALLACFYNANHSPNITGGGYGGRVILPPGYAQIAGTLPIIIQPGTGLIGAGEFASVLCCTSAYDPVAVMDDGNDLPLGAVRFEVNGSPFTSIPGYPTELCNVTILGDSCPGSAVSVASNTAYLQRLWIAGFANGIALSNIDSQVDAVVELCSTGLTFAPFSSGNSVKLLANNMFIGVTVNNRPWLTTNATGSVGGASPVVVIDANQSLNTGYTLNGVRHDAPNFDGFRVTVVDGTGAGQTGVVTAGTSATLDPATWRFVLPITPTGGAWGAACDATSKVVLFDGIHENSLSLKTEVISTTCLNIVQAYGLSVDGFTMSSAATLPTTGAIYVKESEDIIFTSPQAKAAQDYRAASTTKNGMIVATDNKNIQVNGGFFSGWANGIVQDVGCLTDGLTLNGVDCSGNSSRGAAILDGLKTNITGGNYSNNGKTGTPGMGIELSLPNANTIASITGVIANPYVSGAVGNQGTGISVAVSAASAIVNVYGNLSKSHSVADYALSASGAGVVGNIITDPSVTRSLVTVTAAATITIPVSAVGGGTVLVSGNTGITAITATGYSGAKVTLIFSGTPTITDGGNLKLTGNLVATADDTLTLTCDGTNWYEVGRSVN